MEYTTQDFQEYESFIDSQEQNLQGFVADVKCIIQFEKLQTDMMLVLDEMRRLNPEMYVENMCIFEEDMQNRHEIETYVYLKFLLLDNHMKDEFIKHTKSIAFIHNFLIQSRAGVRQTSMCMFIKCLYHLMNLDVLTDFMDITDTYENYVCLDTSKIENMSYRHTEYISHEMFRHFQNFCKLYNRLRLLYKMIYLISNDTEENVVDDFVARYNQSVDKFVIMHNFIHYIYPKYCDVSQNLDDEVEIPTYIPSDRQLIYSELYFDDDSISSYATCETVFKNNYEKENCIRFFIRDFLLFMDYSLEEFSIPLVTCLQSFFSIYAEENPLNIISLINNNQGVRQAIYDSYVSQKNKNEAGKRIQQLERNYNKDDEFKQFLQNISKSLTETEN